jgi:hypothetical protein
VFTERQHRRFWFLVTWVGLGFGLVITVVFAHDYLTAEHWPPAGNEPGAWMLAGLGVFALLVGLFELWRGPRR